MAIYSREINGGVTPATVSETGRKREAGGDDEADRWGPGVSVGRRGMLVPFRDGALLGLRPNLGLG
jgi:hypothetical protein